jgi:hypothetical protein
VAKIQYIYVEKNSDALYRKSKPRQYYKDGILHREFTYRKFTGYELFSDLLFAGVLNEAKEVLSDTWSSYFNFVLIFGCLYTHWYQLMM